MNYLHKQNYHSLLKLVGKRNVKFEDETFEKPILINSAKVFWVRASEIPNSSLFSSKYPHGNLLPGLNSEWITSATSILTTHPSLVEKVIPRNQEWKYDSSNFPGLLRFRFFSKQSFSWTEVVVDDFLPCTSSGFLYSCSKEGTEFWHALLEKAYAKLLGTYENLESSIFDNCVNDLSEFMLEKIKFPIVDIERELELFSKLKLLLQRKSLISISTNEESICSSQLIFENCSFKYNNTYTVVNVVKLNLRLSNLKRKEVLMVKLVNHWINSSNKDNICEDFSLLSQSTWENEWKIVSRRQLNKLGLSFEENGVFFISFEEFLKHSAGVTILHNVNVNRLISNFQYFHFTEAWSIAAQTAGGSVLEAGKFFRNPQFLISINSKSSSVKLLITLTQKSLKFCSNESEFNFDASSSNATLLTIGFVIFRVELNRKSKIDSVYSSDRIVNMVNYSSLIETSEVVEFSSGRYILIPTTTNFGEENTFSLRFLTLPCNAASSSRKSVAIQSLTKSKKILKLNKMVTRYFKTCPIGTFEISVSHLLVPDKNINDDFHLELNYFESGRKITKKSFSMKIKPETIMGSDFDLNATFNISEVEYLRLVSDEKRKMCDGVKEEFFNIEDDASVETGKDENELTNTLGDLESFIWFITKPLATWIELKVFRKRKKMKKFSFDVSKENIAESEPIIVRTDEFYVIMKIAKFWELEFKLEEIEAILKIKVIFNEIEDDKF
ncbi:Calpain-6 [Lobulomyces angularis]|nr:Calpain-6 [Lobulomyces angularis]